MIIKLRGTSEEESWRFFEAHEVQWAETTYKEFKEEFEHLKETDIQVQQFFLGDECLDTYVMARICFYDQNECARQVYTMTTAYLLNDQGKTIDRIN